MKRKHGPWTILSSEQKYKSPWLEVREDQVLRPDGSKGIFSLATIADGSSVLPIDDDGNVYLLKQFRFAIGRDSTETATGGLDHDESPLDAAKRELKEELGISAEEWISLGITHPFTSGVASTAHLFLARKLTMGTPEPDGTEPIELVKMPFDEAYGMALEGRIALAQCCVLIFRAKEFLQK